MTEIQQAVINELRDGGHCIVIWTPEELKEVDPEYLEEIVIERGNNFIESYSKET